MVVITFLIISLLIPYLRNPLHCWIFFVDMPNLYIYVVVEYDHDDIGDTTKAIPIIMWVITIKQHKVYTICTHNVDMRN